MTLFVQLNKEHRFSDSMIVFQIASDILREMAMPLVVSGVNLVLPFVFSLLARIESYEKPKNELYINMLRYVYMILFGNLLTEI